MLAHFFRMLIATLKPQEIKMGMVAYFKVLDEKELEPISKLEILVLDEARAFRKAEFTRSK